MPVCQLRWVMRWLLTGLRSELNYLYCYNQAGSQDNYIQFLISAGQGSVTTLLPYLNTGGLEKLVLLCITFSDAFLKVSVWCGPF